MINIAICDDSQKDIKKLESILLEIMENESTNYSLTTFVCGESLLENWKAFHVVFLDIIMNNESGIDVGQEIKRRYHQTQIIYVTSFDSYYQEAFSVHAFQYIVKPVNEQIVKSIFSEVVAYVNNMIAQNMVSINTDGEAIDLHLQDIYYFEFTERKIRISSSQGDTFIRTSLKNIYEKVKYNYFGVPHKAYIVNFFYIKRINNNNILLTNNLTLPLAQKRASNFKKEYHDFLNHVYTML